MPLTDINEEEFLACARYGLMLAEQNEDGEAEDAYPAWEPRDPARAETRGGVLVGRLTPRGPSLFQSFAKFLVLRR
jgi:hypothetical protein